MYNFYSVCIWHKNYAKMKYQHIGKIAQDDEPLYHWEEIRGLFSSFDGELLRHILHAKIPLEKFIRYELASCGFEEAKQIWTY